MKTQRMKPAGLLIAAFMLLATTTANAQRGRGYAPQGRNFDQNNFCQMIPDLTEDQESKIKDLRIDHLSEMNEFRNQNNELRAKRHTLMTSDNSDLNEINSLIDQMTAVHNKMMKTTAKHRQNVRTLLTDEQKVLFDSRPMHRRGHGRGYGKAAYGQAGSNGIGQGNNRGAGYRMGY